MATEKAIPLFVDPVARDIAYDAMSKRGGQFKGTVYQYTEDTDEVCLRGSNITNDAWEPFSTCDITFVRK